jgi:ATP synthase protein I
MLPANSRQADGISRSGQGDAVTDGKTPDDAGRTRPANAVESPVSEEELALRRRRLEASLSAKGRLVEPADAGAKTSGTAGYGQALRLSSEFIAGVVVGGGLGWFIDRMAGTSPWGLIVFLLLGFGAGVLNVMRGAGVVAEAGIRVPKGPDDREE